ncbi:hypothetical protein [Burkholderia anthina]|uniref:hypothetical protein n=1 Tax=Burkholderia anthina TaxID=179879 RepID=UPI00158A4448|nr:hypothetical protein [Burkholderia anthina]
MMSLLEMLRRLFGAPNSRQRMTETGHGNVQAGTVGRDLTNVTIIHTLNVAAPVPPAEVASPAEASFSTHVSPVNVEPQIAQASPTRGTALAPESDNSVPQATLPVDRDIVTLRRELFDLLEQFDKTPDRRVIVLNWMEQQFGTKRVVNLDRMQLVRTVRWSAVVLKDRKKKREERGTAVR